jgi:hypothetical protein
MWGNGQCYVLVGEKKKKRRRIRRSVCVPTKNNILVQASKILPTISPIYGVNPSISQCCAGDIVREREKKKKGEQNM